MPLKETLLNALPFLILLTWGHLKVNAVFPIESRRFRGSVEIGGAYNN
jgi:hypothetical protein